MLSVRAVHVQSRVLDVSYSRVVHALNTATLSRRVSARPYDFISSGSVISLWGTVPNVGPKLTTRYRSVQSVDMKLPRRKPKHRQRGKQHRVKSAIQAYQSKPIDAVTVALNRVLELSAVS